MGETGKTDGSPVVQLRCTVSASGVPLQAGFEQDFCQALASNLTQHLGPKFRLTAQSGWTGEGRAVAVDIRVASKSRAEVTTSYGEVSQGIFTPGSSASSSLDVVDGPLTPASSRVLVRGIGLQMGLVR
jgi:hypothetical protein